MPNTCLNQIKDNKKETPSSSNDSDGGMFDSRPFVLQSKTAEKLGRPDLKKSLLRSERYGHHLSQIDCTNESVPTTTQPKLSSQSNNTQAIQMMMRAGGGRRGRGGRVPPPAHRLYNLRGRQVHAFEVQRHHLNTGTGTTRTTRNHVNDPATTVPQQVSFSYRAGGLTGNGEFANVPNTRPRGSGNNWDAGHFVAKQNGGLGHVTHTVFPQNPQINQGHLLRGERTYPLWKGHEHRFNRAIRNTGRTGHWTVITRDRPRVRYHPYL